MGEMKIRGRRGRVFQSHAESQAEQLLFNYPITHSSAIVEFLENSDAIL